MLIDAANEHDKLLELCRDLGVRQVVETHGHWDHIQAVPAVRDAGYEVGVTAADAAMLPSYDLVLEDELGDRGRPAAACTPSPPRATPPARCASPRGDARCCSAGTPSSPAGPGNTSFADADFATIIRSIEDRLFAAFGPDTIVLPGHGADTTIGTESPHLAGVDRPGLVAARAGAAQTAVDGLPGLADQLDLGGQPADRHPARAPRRPPRRSPATRPAGCPATLR